MRIEKPARTQAGVVATLGLLLFVGAASAGDPIQFSGDKARPAPANEKPAIDSDLFKSWNRPATTRSPSSVNPLTPFITSGRSLDPKEERRLRNAREERKNWMLLEPGELQKRDDEEEMKFGGREFSFDLGDEDEGDYLFHGLAEPNSDKARARPAPADIDDAPKNDNRGSLKIIGGRENEGGAHTSRELNLKGLINTTQVDPNKFERNEPSLFQFFKDNAVQVDRDAQMRRETFREFINGPQHGPPLAAPSGVRDPINFRPDLTQSPLNPVVPARPAFELPPSAKGAETFAIRPPSGSLNPARAAGFADAINPSGRQPLPGALPSPYLMPNEPPKKPVGGIMGGPLFNREAPRRGGL